MLSGIGDEAELRALGIEVKHALPGVGANYHDHLAAGILMEMSNSESYGISLRAAPRGVWNLIRIRPVSQRAAGEQRFRSQRLCPFDGRISIDPTCRSFSSRRGAIPARFRFRSGTASP